jgi:enoyl-CoA hydratase/carnithine racemase
MAHDLSDTESTACWTLEWHGRAAVARMADDVLAAALDLNEFRQSLDLFDSAGACEGCRCLLLLGSPACFSPERCDEFWQLAHGSASVKAGRLRLVGEAVAVAREENGFLKLISRIRSVPKPVVIALQGDVAFPFLGMALACDGRIAGDDLVLHNRCMEVGAPPAGGLSGMLPRFVGFGKASDILLRTRTIDAQTALQMGLVDKIVPSDRFEDAVLEAAAEWEVLHPETVAAVKRLMNIHLKDEAVFVEAEVRELERATARMMSSEDGEGNGLRVL